MITLVCSHNSQRSAQSAQRKQVALIQDPSPVLYDFDIENINPDLQLNLKIAQIQSREAALVEDIWNKGWFVQEELEAWIYSVYVWRLTDNLSTPVSTSTISRNICALPNTRLLCLRDTLRMAIELDRSFPPPSKDIAAD